MIIINEQAARQLVSPQDAIDAVDKTFRELFRESARNFSVIREKLVPSGDVYGIKAGYIVSTGTLGLKIGGYWPGNRDRGLTNHQSTTVLTDPSTGNPLALVSSNYLTGVRTAAACAIGIRELARKDARTLGVIGAGAQALFHIDAAQLVRNFDVILVADHDLDRAHSLAGEVSGGVRVQAANIEAVVRQAAVLITLTPSQGPIVKRDWVQPGTHISAMGADTVGKQELETDLVLAASVWNDEWSQSCTIGECQHAAKLGLKTKGSIGAVLEGKAPGRCSEDEITIFDSTGLAIQDLAVAAWAFDAARENLVNGVQKVDLGR